MKRESIPKDSVKFLTNPAILCAGCIMVGCSLTFLICGLILCRHDTDSTDRIAMLLPACALIIMSSLLLLFVGISWTIITKEKIIYRRLIFKDKVYDITAVQDVLIRQLSYVGKYMIGIAKKKEEMQNEDDFAYIFFKIQYSPERLKKIIPYFTDVDFEDYV